MLKSASIAKPASINCCAEGSGVAVNFTVAELKRAEPPPSPPSTERSVKTSKKLVVGNDAESVSIEKPDVAREIKLIELAQPVGEFPANIAPGHTLRVPVTAPSPVAKGEFSVIPAPVSCALDALNLKNDSKSWPAFAPWFRVNCRVGINCIPAGFTITCSNGMGVAPFCPGAELKPENVTTPFWHPAAPKLT